MGFITPLRLTPCVIIPVKLTLRGYYPQEIDIKGFITPVRLAPWVIIPVRLTPWGYYPKEINIMGLLPQED